MEEKKITLFDMAAQTAVIFVIFILSIVIPGQVIDQKVAELSSFYELSPKGISYATIWQALAASVVITCLRTFIFGSKLLWKVRILYKTILMVSCVILAIALFSWKFYWFPMDNTAAWISFFVSFFVYFGLGVAIMMIRTKREDKKYERLLKEYKERKEKDS